MEWKVLAFQTKDAWWHDRVDSNPKSMSVEEIIWTLKNKFCSLKAQVLWSPYEVNKLDMDGELSCLNLAMNKLAESQKRDQSVGNGRYQYGKARYLSGITCFWCHKKGLLQENRPLAKKAGKITVNKEINGSEPSTDWRYKRPEKKSRD